jgi:metallo-beta-lactamase class B
MNKKVFLTLLSFGLMSPAFASGDIMTAQAHAEKGLSYADDFPGLASLCDINKPIRDMAHRHKPTTNKQSSSEKKSKKRSSAIPPTQVFDNLYYVGTGGVASWALKTSDGIILIDALNNNDQAEKYIEQGLIQLGLDPKDIKYLIITHGHGDHYGGQEFLVTKYHPRVVMSDKEWTLLEKPKQDFSSPRWGEKPVRDMSVHNGDSISLGDTDLTIYLTPGHTPGTISLVFPVYDEGKKHVASLWGGTGLNYGPKLDRIQSYAESANYFKHVVKDSAVDVFMSNHPTRDGSAKKIAQLSQRVDDETHPFVIGQTQSQNAYDMLYHCTKAQALKINQSQ